MTVHIVASCTDRKRASVDDELRLREVESGGDRAAAWLERLAQSKAQTKPASELYGGEHWQLVLDLEAELGESSRENKLWVASAGYGLVPATAPLKAYSATFADRQPDSVPADSASAWWAALCEGHSHAESLQAVASRADALVVIASAKYLRAMLPDLRQAREVLAERLIVFSGFPGTDLESELGSSLVRVDGRVQVALSDQPEVKLRGTKQGLAARTAKHLLTQTETWPPTATELQKAYDQLVEGLVRPQAPVRAESKDDQVREFIVASLDADPDARRTKLLRAWRDSGRACEQSRFRDLYLEIKAKRK